MAKGRARILAVTVSRKGTRLVAAFRVLVRRPRQPGVARPDSRVGVDVGVRVLATVASSRGQVIERVPNPRPLEAALKELRRLCRERSRRARGSRRYAQTSRRISRLQRRVADIRGCHIHRLTARLAKTHGEIVVEGLDAAGMLRQKGLHGGPRQTARPVGLRPRRDPPPARLQERLVRLPARDRRPVLPLVEDLPRVRARPGHRVGRALDLRTGCGTAHQRDDNAAVNLARYEPPCAGDSAVGPVRAAVKRRADRETGPRPAGGDEARKGRGRTAAEQPRDGVPA